MHITIRKMELQDVKRVHEIDVASFSLPWPERSYRFELEENPASRLFVAEVQDEKGDSNLVGMAVMWFILDEAHIGTFAIDSAYRRMGIGRKLLAETLLQAYNNGVRRCYLEVRRSNEAAQALYHSFGFQVTTIRAGYYRDNGEDALLMTLDPIRLETLQDLLEIKS
jgi:ribosomal-protein-alanine N-acetyltransferase